VKSESVGLFSMSIELPEAQILGEQMREVLVGKVAKSFDVKDYEKLIKIGFMNKNLNDYKALVGRKVEAVIYRGNVDVVKFDRGMNLAISPEYGGIVSYTEKGDTPNYHFRLRFKDDSALTVRLTSMGGVIALDDEKLLDSYMYKRDFGNVQSPLDEDFTLIRFQELLSEKNRMLKSVLVGKDAVIIGLSNATYQDAIYRAGLHPKRKASSLNEDESKLLYDSIIGILNERIRLGGKEQFQDLYGVKGGYVAAMGPHMKKENCQKCGSPIKGIAHGGGKVYLCSNCQI